MRRISRTAVLAAAAGGVLALGTSAQVASAADLGGGCCADLEERIAELEATTARKGNRKVSLTVTGWVAEQIIWWDDGRESNVYITGTGRNLHTNVNFTGAANITKGWSAGYTITVGITTADPYTVNANSDEGIPRLSTFGVTDTENGVEALQSFWFVKSDQYGKIGIGKLSQASDNTAILPDGSGSLVPANVVLFDGGGFAVNRVGGGTIGSFGGFGTCATTNAALGGDCNGVIENVVKYDSPTFGGFGFSASWGEDDMWDVAARYVAEFNGIKFAAAAAYAQVTDENLVISDGFGPRDVSYFQAGAYLQHVPTGLFVYGYYGVEDIGGGYGAFRSSQGVSNDPYHWYAKAGIRQRWTSLGHTVLYGEYAEYNDQMSPDLVVAGVTDSKLERWGVGVVQELDAAATSIWLAYRHFDVEATQGGLEVNTEPLHLVKFGALIAF